MDDKKAKGRSRSAERLTNPKTPESPTSPSRYGAVDRAVSSQDIEALPDLTEKIIEHGMYAEYMEYRRGYMEWRKGGAKGAQGELNVEAVKNTSADDPYKFEMWYPTPDVFMWRFTTAYWTAVLFLQGSILFTFNAGVGVCSGMSVFNQHLHWLPSDMRTMTTWPNAIGGMLFVVGAYFSYLQFINVSTDRTESMAYFIGNWEGVMSKVTKESAIGTLSYFLGASLFQVGCFACLVPDLSRTAEICLVILPNFLGSLGFCVGAICEVNHNQLFREGGATWDQPVWWAALADLVGGFLFLTGCMPDIVAPSWTGEDKRFFVDLTFFIGSALFCFSSALLIVMWRANDFGLTLLNQLNHAIKAKGVVSLAPAPGPTGEVGIRVQLPATSEALQGTHPVKEDEQNEQNFSTRTVMYIIVYCYFFCIAIIDTICKQLWHYHSYRPHTLRHFTDIAIQVFVVLVIMLVLLLHSAVTDVPGHEPYRFIMIAGRTLLVAGAISQTITFVDFLSVPYDRI